MDFVAGVVTPVALAEAVDEEEDEEEEITDPAGGRQTITYATCNTANKGKSFKRPSTGSETNDGNRIAKSTSTRTGWIREYALAAFEERIETGGAEGFMAGGWVEGCCVDDAAALAGRGGEGGVEVMAEALDGLRGGLGFSNSIQRINPVLAGFSVVGLRSYSDMQSEDDGNS